MFIFDNEIKYTSQQICDELKNLGVNFNIFLENDYTNICYDKGVINRLLKKYPQNEKLNQINDLMNKMDCGEYGSIFQKIKELSSDFYLGSFKYVDSTIDNKDWETCYMVVYNEKHNVYLRLQGRYEDGGICDLHTAIPIYPKTITTQIWSPEILVVTESFVCEDVVIMKNDVLKYNDMYYETHTYDMLEELEVEKLMKHKDKLKPWEPISDDELKTIIAEKVEMCSDDLKKSPAINDYINSIRSLYMELPGMM